MIEVLLLAGAGAGTVHAQIVTIVRYGKLWGVRTVKQSGGWPLLAEASSDNGDLSSDQAMRIFRGGSYVRELKNETK
jgi:hypothetical protein